MDNPHLERPSLTSGESARAAWRGSGGHGGSTAYGGIVSGTQLGNGGAYAWPGKNGKAENGLPGFILYDHHQSRIVVPALFSQLPDCALGVEVPSQHPASSYREDHP